MEQLNSHYLFQAAGDIIELNAWAPENAIEECDHLHSIGKNIKTSRDPKDLGYKIAYEYYSAPDSWDMPKNTKDAGYLEYNQGSFLYPHRDKWRKLNTNSLRLLCFLNNTRPTEFCFVYDKEIITFEPRRWYVVNTQKLHYGFSFVDGVKHIGVALTLTNETHADWLLNKLTYPQPLEKDAVVGNNKGGVGKKFF